MSFVFTYGLRIIESLLLFSITAEKLDLVTALVLKRISFNYPSSSVL